MPDVLRTARVAIVHDYLNQPGGAEKVVEVFARMFPGAPIYTSVFDPQNVPPIWRTYDVRTSFMQRIAPGLKLARALFPLYPFAFESFDLRGYDLVLSSTTAFAKGVITNAHTCHVCYCNNVTRFLWMTPEYLARESLPAALKALIPLLAVPLRVWDYTAAQRVDHYIAGSHNAAARIRKFYRRESEVVHSPIDTSRFYIAPDTGNYFLVASRLQSYKRIDLAVDACTRLGLPLHVLGDGPDRPRLQRLAGPTVTFFGRVSDADLAQHLAHCRAFLFPGEEDFGLAPLEAQASGRPVIAFRAGGALETVVEGTTGLFFDRQRVDDLARILAGFRDDFDPELIRSHALTFDLQAFVARLYAAVARAYLLHRDAQEVPADD